LKCEIKTNRKKYKRVYFAVIYKFSKNNNLNFKNKDYDRN